MKSKYFIIPALFSCVLGTGTAANALTAYSFTPENISYSYCNEFSGGTGVQCTGNPSSTTSTEVITFAPTPILFTYDSQTNTVDTTEFIAQLTVEKPGYLPYTFTSASYDTATNILTFTGAPQNFPLSPSGNLVTPPIFAIRLNSPLVDLTPGSETAADGTFPGYSLSRFYPVCSRWLNNGNAKCDITNLVEIPSPFSILAIMPLAAIGKLRRRYT
jgi:hypothetical protein